MLLIDSHTQSSFQVLDISSLWTALLPDFVISTVMAQPRTIPTARFCPIASKLSLPANNAGNALWSGYVSRVPFLSTWRLCPSPGWCRAFSHSCAGLLVAARHGCARGKTADITCRLTVGLESPLSAVFSVVSCGGASRW